MSCRRDRANVRRVATRCTPTTLERVSRSLKVAGVIVIACVFATSCGVGSDDDANIVTTVDKTVGPSHADGSPTCESFDGMPTEDVANHFNSGQPCAEDIGLDDRRELYPGLGDQECADGTFLYWNDVGWGASEGEWIATTDGLPPDDVMDAC